MESIPLSEILACMDHDEDFNTVNWLSKLNNSTIDRICKLGEAFYNSDNDDDFDRTDYITLCTMIAELECKTDASNISEDKKVSCLSGLLTFATCEKMRRDGIIKFRGSGKITQVLQNSTDIELTNVGKMLSSSMKTMMEISKEIENK